MVESRSCTNSHPRPHGRGGAVSQLSHFLEQNALSRQSQPFRAALSALSNLICFKSCRSHRIISGLESSENRCAALLSISPPLQRGLIRRQINQTGQWGWGGSPLLSWAPVIRVLTQIPGGSSTGPLIQVPSSGPIQAPVPWTWLRCCPCWPNCLLCSCTGQSGFESQGLVVFQDKPEFCSWLSQHLLWLFNEADLADVSIFRGAGIENIHEV